MPGAARHIWRQLGMLDPIESVRTSDLHWGRLRGGQEVGAVLAVFPRLDSAPAIRKMEDLEIAEKARQDIIMGKTPDAATGAPAPQPEKATISIDDFAKVDLRVGVVASAERVKGADKLLHLKVDIGEPEPRTIVAGIAEVYEPDKLVGRKVVIVANLEPRKLRGLTSQGMIVAASIEGGKPVLAGFLEDVPLGARLK
jgi:methionyl-tRNA synthetase